MKLAILAPLVAPIREPHCGGSQAFVVDLARGLLARGHDVHLHAASGSHVPGVEVMNTGVDPRALASTLYRAHAPGVQQSRIADEAFATAYAVIAGGRYDLVHNHAFDAPAINLAERAEAPVLHTLHLPPSSAVVGALHDAARGETPPAVACVSASQAEQWRAHFAVDALLPPYVPTRAIRFAAAAPRRALFAGRLSPEKGAGDAIDVALAAGLEIDVFGDAYDADYAREQIEPRGTLPGVRIHGAVPRPALWDAMAQASVVLCTPRWEEPFGMAAAEAQACGTPVVGFARGGLVELVVEGETGFLVAPGCIDAAAQAVRASESLSRERCRRHAERALDLERTLDAHERVCEQLVAGAVRSSVGG